MNKSGNIFPIMTKFIDIHTHSEKLINHSILSITNYNPVITPFFSLNNFFSSGIHPLSLNIENIKWYMKVVSKIANHENCVAIGECGLDFRFSNINKKYQTEIFYKHINISQEDKLPLIIHSACADDEIIFAKRNSNSKNVWIIHGFENSIPTAKQYLNEGMYLSAGQKAMDTKFAEVIKYIPDDRLFAETNKSKSEIINIYKCIANAKNVSINHIAQMLESNFRKCFPRCFVQPQINENGL